MRVFQIEREIVYYSDDYYKVFYILKFCKKEKSCNEIGELIISTYYLLSRDIEISQYFYLNSIYRLNRENYIIVTLIEKRKHNLETIGTYIKETLPLETKLTKNFSIKYDLYAHPNFILLR